jgi:hypothetical protein
MEELLAMLAVADCVEALIVVGDAARTPEGRAGLTMGAHGASLLGRLAELLSDPTASVLAKTKCVRAVGNLVIDSEETREQAVARGLVRGVVAAGCDATDIGLLLVVCGALTNLCCDSPATSEAAVQSG